MPKVWGQQQDSLIAVSFNDLGQPNDVDKASTLAHFLGTIARNGRYCPLNYKDWRLMPSSYKDEMLRIVKKISTKNKETRARLQFLHRMGKKSFALMKEILKKQLGRYPTRAELFKECYYKADGSSTSLDIEEAIEKMQEVAADDVQNLNDSAVIHDPNDSFAKIMGKDKDGQLRMYGIGVTANDVYGGKPSRASLLRQAMEYKEKYLSEVGSYVVLKSLANINEIVATGIVNKIGGVRVSGMELGLEFCQVIVQCQMKKDARLLFPHGLIQTIGDALGAPVAWPLSLVTLDEDEI